VPGPGINPASINLVTLTVLTVFNTCDIRFCMRVLKKIKNRLLSIFYGMPRFIFINFYRLFVVRIRIINTKKIPDNSSAIFTFNHTTGADPIVILGALRKKIYFIADSDRFRTRFTDFFFRKFTNSIPIFKNEFLKNISSFKELFTIARNKKTYFGIFPEGNLFKKGLFGKFNNGAAYLSYKTKLPIIPVYIHDIHNGPDPDSKCGRNPIWEGIYSLFSNTFRKIHIFIGSPINPVAENILSDLKELADKDSYKDIIRSITSRLENDYFELKKEADSLFGQGKVKSGKKPISPGLKKTGQHTGSAIDENAEESAGDIEDIDLAHNIGGTD